ncbi:hypothetical protein GCM10027596_31710 [Nocardioides korecus]
MRDLTEPAVAWTDAQHTTFLRQIAGDRFSALWHLAVTSGVGLAELARLRRHQVDVIMGELRMGSPQDADGRAGRRRGQTDLIFVIEPVTLEVVRRHVAAWERDRRSTFPEATHLFLRSDGRRVAVEDVVAMFQIHCLRAGVPVVDATGRQVAQQTVLSGPRVPASASRDAARPAVSASGLLPNLWVV